MADRKIENTLAERKSKLESKSSEFRSRLEQKSPKRRSKLESTKSPDVRSKLEQKPLDSRAKLEQKSPESRLPKKRQRRFSYLTIIVALIAIYLFISVVYSSFKFLELRKQESEIQGDIAAQEQIAKDLKSEIEYLKTDAAVEKLAREELGLVRPDEILILPKKS